MELESADRKDTTASHFKSNRIKEKIKMLDREMRRLADLEKQIAASPDQQISLTDPDARSMATSGRGSGMVGYNVQTAVDTTHHLIVTHEVTQDGHDRRQLHNMALQAKTALGSEHLEVVADRGYFRGEEVHLCDQSNITTYLPALRFACLSVSYPGEVPWEGGWLGGPLDSGAGVGEAPWRVPWQCALAGSLAECLGGVPWRSTLAVCLG